MKLKTILLTLISLLSCIQMWGENIPIPAEYTGEGNWNTLKTENGYYFYAIEENGITKLGQTKSAPNSDNYAAYCWKIEGNEFAGYTFRCLKYENEEKMYITNPSKLQTYSEEVLLTHNPSRYYYTYNHQLQLVDCTDLYLAFYSQYHSTVRLHNSANYIGSIMRINAINEWKVEACIKANDNNGQEQYLSGGGINLNGTYYYHGSSFRSDVQTTNPSQITIAGYSNMGTEIDAAAHTIKSYYKLKDESYFKDCTVKTAAISADGDNVVTGENNVVWSLDPNNYITNTSGNYDYVPGNKVWRMEIVVYNNNAGTSALDPSFNEWGSTILSSGGNPFDGTYYNEFQLYHHSPTRPSGTKNTLNFKASKNSDYIVAQGNLVNNSNYKTIITYNANGVYVIRTIFLDAEGKETDRIYDNVWTSNVKQNDIHQLSCALPSGINLKSLRISIAEESNLLEDVEYYIQNSDKNYLNGNAVNTQTSDWYSLYGIDAAKYQIVWTGNKELTYTDTDGGLHNSFYIKVKPANNNTAQWQWLGTNNTLVTDQAKAQAYIYSTAKCIQPITAKNTVSDAWETSATNNKWNFDLFANYLVEVAGNNSGQLKIYSNTDPVWKNNNDYVELPSNFDIEQLGNKSILGYSAAITKQDIRLKVQYTPLEDTFYNYTKKNSSENTLLYYWYKEQGKLVSYSTTNILSGQNVSDNWGEMGDCSQWNIVKAPSIPYVLKKNTAGQDADNNYYGTIYSPDAITIPYGVEAYYATCICFDEGHNEFFKLKKIENVIPKRTAAILISSNDISGGQLSLYRNQNSIDQPSGNILQGYLIDTPNKYASEKNNISATSNIYVLSGKEGIGFYPYTGINIPAFRAFYEDSSSSQSKFRFMFEDEDTAIEQILDDSEHSDNERVIYNLMGQRVDEITRGNIYIVNGKRMIVK